MNRDQVLQTLNVEQTAGLYVLTTDEILAFASRIEAATREECEEDAKRYRYLTKNCVRHNERTGLFDLLFSFKAQHGAVDAAIDKKLAAIRKSEG